MIGSRFVVPGLPPAFPTALPQQSRCSKDIGPPSSKAGPMPSATSLESLSADTRALQDSGVDAALFAALGQLAIYHHRRNLGARRCPRVAPAASPCTSPSAAMWPRSPKCRPTKALSGCTRWSAPSTAASRGWNPGGDRAPVPVPHDELVARFKQWAAAVGRVPATNPRSRPSSRRDRKTPVCSSSYITRHPARDIPGPPSSHPDAHG